MRICSLLPSATEIVYALGLGEQLVAVTHECDYPPAAIRLPAITQSAIDHTNSSGRDIHNHVTEAIHAGSSIYHLDQRLLKELDPDLILTQELCQVCAVSYGEVRRAARILEGDRRILSLEPTNLAAMLETIVTVGETAGVHDQAQALVGRLRARIEAVSAKAAGASSRPKVFAMEWLDPPFAGGHWVPEMIRLAGGLDGLGHEGRPSEAVGWDRIAAYDPEVIVLMPCGYNLERTVREARATAFPGQWSGLRAVRQGGVFTVDGSAYFNRPGPRLVDGLEIMAEVLHPELFPRTKPLSDWQRTAA